MSDFPGVRLHVVSGKGGTGKTTVAAALALALAGGGRRVLLAEVEGRQGIAQLFDCPPLDYAERKVAGALDGGDVYAMAVEPEQALLEYLDMFYHLGRAGRAMRRMGAIDFATTIAPGITDVLVTGKIKEAVGRGARGRPTYDAVVLDAPPTGRITRFLNVNSEVAGLAKMGPVHSQAQSVMALLASHRTAVHLVTLLEEMPVQETVDAAAELTKAGLPVGAVVVNMTREPMLPPEALVAAGAGRMDLAELSRGLAAGGLSASLQTIAGLVAEAVDHAQRMALEETERDALAEVDRPTYELPLLEDGVDLGGLYRLATALAHQGAR
jgi:anion-transporting  ArsA/GET3 family ATPase